MINRIGVVAYGGICYLLFAGTFGYFILFVGGILVPRTVDSGPPTSLLEAISVNLGLLLLFGLQHSVMARRSFKQWWTRIVPASIERSTYVLASTLVTGLLLWQWRPMPEVVWHVDHSLGEALLWALFAGGWTVTLITTFLIDHFELFGLRQVWARWKQKKVRPPVFQTPLFYRIVRHPMQAGIVLGLWATPHMTAGHLLLAVGMTIYVLIGLYFEERDIVRTFGSRYETYRERVPKLVPRLRRSSHRQGRDRRPPVDVESVFWGSKTCSRGFSTSDTVSES